MPNKFTENRIKTARASGLSAVEGFFIRFRSAIFLFIALLIAAAVALGVYLYVTGTSAAKQLTALDAIVFAYEKAVTPEDDKKDSSNPDIYYADSNEEADKIVAETAEEKEAKKAAKVEADKAAAKTALDSLDSSGLTEKKGIAGIRANMFKAGLLFAEEKWEDARSAWLTAADLDKKSYMAALSWYNAAVCSEELDDKENAIAYYEKCIATEDFTLLAHAIFNAGRVKDESGDYKGAAEHYQKLVDAYPESGWTNIAHSRLLSLRIEEKVE
ncbi:MAG: hypothetical protein Ta2A_10270 [Treponemataceae bacterium]|nr:MAG: hypothetical protein Ta2A_10270 [Treponemataceae bacterium]